MRLAIVADWLPTLGGAERVVAECCALWPDAPLFTTVAKHGRLGVLDRAPVRTTSLQALFRLLGNHQLLLPFMPRIVEDIDLRGYDVVLSSSHAVGKGVIPPSNAVHVCYCHTPMRYAWEMEEEYLRDFGVPRMLKGAVKRQLRRLRRWDLQTAKRVDVFVANSRSTQERIARTYARESTVLHPPVHDSFFAQPIDGQREGFLAVGRLVPYKRFDLLVDLANVLALPLRVVGEGSDLARLRQRAGPTVSFLGHVREEELPRYYAGAKALLFPQIEDAGVVPLEAQACGTPVIALGAGGALDTVVDGVTGVLFPEQTTASLSAALERFASRHFDPHVIREHAKGFSSERFGIRLQEIVVQARAQYSR